MIEQDNIQNELHGLSNKNPFKVPENYFEELPMQIQKRLEENRSGIKVIEMLRPKLAYAAMIAVLLTIGFMGIRSLFINNTQISLSIDEIENAIDYFGYEFEDEMLISALVDADIEYFPEFSEAETDQVIQYLADEYIDFSEIMDKQ